MHPIDTLTENERACLRLVIGGHFSKDIARELKISSHTVDARLKRAMQKLGVASRFEAARLMREAEGGAATYQPLVYQPSELSGQAGAVDMGASPDAAARGDVAFGHDGPRGVPATSDTIVAGPLANLPLPIRRSQRNDLTVTQRLVWIVILAFLGMIAIGAFLGGLDAFARIISADIRPS